MSEDLFKPKIETPYNYLSLGAGVQSSCLALMAAHGEIGPMPDGAIFADTQAEPKSVYDWLDWLEKQLPFPVHRVTKGSLTKEALTMRVTKDGRKFSRCDVPFFTLNADGSQGKIFNRSCTKDFKILPILKWMRQAAGIKRGQKEVTVTSWIGISWDEIQRMKESREPWVQHRWPLLELRMRRRDCIDWMKQNGYPEPPRSSCVYCPFHNNAEWRRLKAEEPEEFQKAVEFERELQRIKGNTDNMHAVPFLHRTLVPLDQVDLRTDEDKGQMQMDFGSECEGMCGL